MGSARARNKVRFNQRNLWVFIQLLPCLLLPSHLVRPQVADPFFMQRLSFHGLLSQAPRAQPAAHNAATPQDTCTDSITHQWRARRSGLSLLQNKEPQFPQ